MYVCSNAVVLTTLVCLEALCPQYRRVRRFKSLEAGEIVRAKGGREGQESDEGQGSLINFSRWCHWKVKLFHDLMRCILIES